MYFTVESWVREPLTVITVESSEYEKRHFGRVPSVSEDGVCAVPPVSFPSTVKDTLFTENVSFTDETALNDIFHETTLTEEEKTTAYDDELSETVTLPTSEYCGFRPAGESEIPIETLAPSSPSRVNLIATAELISNESGISASAFISAFALSSAFTVIRSSDISPPVIPIAEKRFAYTACGVSPHMREEIAIEVTNAF